jgi:hypothetical protein
MSDIPDLEYSCAHSKPTRHLHIGYPKIGSLAFQVFFAHTVSCLSAAGNFYPRLESFAAAAHRCLSSSNRPLGALKANWLLA